MSMQHSHLVCPDCKRTLGKSPGSDALFCPQCGSCWTPKNGIPWFVDDNTEVVSRWTSTYEDVDGAGMMSRLRRRQSHWGIPALYERLIRPAAEPAARILDLGCGGGWRFLTRHGTVTGVDVAYPPLRTACGVYEEVIGAWADRLPLPDHSFDIVTSVWMVEHLTRVEFSAMLEEIRRVLKAGGQLIFLADLHSNKPVLRYARRHPAEYQKYHVDAVGHVGLRSLEDTRHLLEQGGFIEETTLPLNKSSVLQPVTALWMFGNELGDNSRLIRSYVGLCRLVMKSPRLYRMVYSLLFEYHRLMDRLLPDDYAFSALFSWRTPGP